MTEMVTSGSMSGDGRRSDGLLGECGYERCRTLQAPPALYATAPCFDSTEPFVLPGVSQYRTSFFIFAVATVGGALMLAWLYGRTASILLCIMFHAAWNAIVALGFVIPSHRASLALLDASLKVVVGSLLLASSYGLSNKRMHPTAAAGALGGRG